jgi:hypothetical protein
MLIAALLLTGWAAISEKVKVTIKVNVILNTAQ